MGVLVFGQIFSLYILDYAEAKEEYKTLSAFLERKEVCGPQGAFSGTGENFSEAYLKRQNPDYIFWLSIPGTSVNYPVARNGEPEYYLNHTFQGTENPCGCLFVQGEIKDLYQGNTVIFGHNMKDGSMFADLKNYRKADFYSGHPTIQIYYKGRWEKCSIFSCQLRADTDFRCYQTNFSGIEEKEKFISEMRASSLYDIPFESYTDRPVITLSTCFGTSKRMIVQAVLV